MAYCLMSEVLDDVPRSRFDKYLKNNDDYEILATPDKLMFPQRERLSWLKLCLQYARHDKNFNRDLQTHTQHYHWINNNYKQVTRLSKKDFLTKLRTDLAELGIKKIQSELTNLQTWPQRIRRQQKNIRLTTETRKLFKLIVLLTYWQDERKAVLMPSISYLDEILHEIAGRTSVPYDNLLHYYRPQVADLLIRSQHLTQKQVGTQKQLSISIGSLDRGRVRYDVLNKTDAQAAWRIFARALKPESAPLHGIVACTAGKKSITGRANIVMDAYAKKFRRDEILVTGMTRPDFLPLMRRARAIITNEGGLTCHAAVVAREFNKPCIIGTKSATRKLKDGARVRLDLVTGDIEILKA